MISSPTLAAGTVSPFCIARGGEPRAAAVVRRTAGIPTIGHFPASGDLHGNCVQNIDYHGEVSTAPAAAPSGATQR